jgi:Mg2+/Co2+ transporter CorC
MREAGHVLHAGEDVLYDGLVFHVERVERRRLVEVKLEIPLPEKKPGASENGGAAKQTHA